MQITFKLYASLGEYLPADRRRGNELSLDVAEGATIEQVIAPFGLPPKLVHPVLINGVFILPAEPARGAVLAGDVLATSPPVAGG